MNIADYHIHTDYTDGLSSIDEIAQYCSLLGIKEIALSEHVRKKMDYDYLSLKNDVSKASKKYPIRIFIAAEAKILQDGELDISDEIKKQTDFIVGSVHTWPEDKDKYHSYRLLCHSACTIIGHPKFIDKLLLKMINDSNKILEINYRYQLSEKQLMLIKEFPLIRVCFGSDAHSLLDIKKGQQYFNQLLKNVVDYKQIWLYEKNS